MFQSIIDYSKKQKIELPESAADEFLDLIKVAFGMRGTKRSRYTFSRQTSFEINSIKLNIFLNCEMGDNNQVLIGQGNGNAPQWSAIALGNLFKTLLCEHFLF